MAHECPHCKTSCHCGGDIDDIIFAGTPEEFACTCCDADVYPEIWCATCGYIESEDDHEPICSHFRE